MRVPLPILSLMAGGVVSLTAPMPSGARLKKTLAEIEKSLDDRFYRVGRSAIVNLSCIARVTRSDIFLNEGDRIPLPRGAYEGVNRAIIQRG